MSDEIESHISRISTQWDLLARAHPDQPGAAEAQRLLLRRYYGAVFRYLLAAVGSADAAEDLSQEFALRFVRGDFQRADPQRGRFRDYLKTALQNLVIDHRRRQRGRPVLLPADLTSSAPESELPEGEWDRLWRAELLSQAWQALEKLEQQGGSPFYTVLRWRADNPEQPLAQMIEGLGHQGRSFTEVNLRQILRRARKRFASLLLEEVGRSLETDDRDRLEQELSDLNLLTYCQSALKGNDPPVP
jgi:RNA polymerase sigma-70 factor (ECF subfamily)